MRTAWDIFAIVGAVLLICVTLKMPDDEACSSDEALIRRIRYSVFVYSGLMLTLSVVWRAWSPELPDAIVLANGDIILFVNFVALSRRHGKGSQKWTGAIRDAEK